MCGSPYFLTVRDELARCQVPERAVRPLLIVVEAPGFDLLPRVLERDELMHLQALVAQAPLKDSMWAFCTGLPGWMRTTEEMLHHKRRNFPGAREEGGEHAEGVPPSVASCQTRPA